MGKFTFKETRFEGMYIVEQTVFGDSRGFFMETYNKNDFVKAGIDADFVQDNHSRSSQGVLRGLHFQIKNPQGKLVRSLSGEIFDVVVDMRRDSKTFGNWYGIYLSDINRRQLYVPPGLAHGFLVTSKYAEIAYKCTAFYDPTDEGGIIWSDAGLAIAWPIKNAGDIILSEKDSKYKTFAEIQF